MEFEELINRIITTLNSKDLPPDHNRYNGQDHYDGQDHLGLTDVEKQMIYDNIPKDRIVEHPGTREKIGCLRVTSENGYVYLFEAMYSISNDRTETWEKIEISLGRPNKVWAEFSFVSKRRTFTVTGEAEEIARRIISRLDEKETETDIWTLGASLEGEAKALFNKIIKQNDKNYNLSIIGDDGLEYFFNALEKSECGGSEWRDSGSLTIECPVTGLKKEIYSYSYYSR